MKKSILKLIPNRCTNLIVTVGLLLIVMISACQSVSTPFIPKSNVEQFWSNFVSAMEKNDTAFLHQHSLPFIECAECDTGKWEQTEFKATTFFKNYPKLLIPPKHANYSIQIDTVNRVPFVEKMPVSMHRVNYSVSCTDCPEGGYNIIYTLVEVADNEFRFQGKFSVP